MVLEPLLAAAFYAVGTAYYAVALWLLIKQSRDKRERDHE